MVSGKEYREERRIKLGKEMVSKLRVVGLKKENLGISKV